MKMLLKTALVLLLAAANAQAAWWDNRYAVLKADGLATGFAPDLGRSRFESEGLRAVLADKKIGFQDSAQRWVIPPQFVYVLPFHQGRAVVWTDPKQAPRLIDRTGTVVGEAPALGKELVTTEFTESDDLLYYAADRQGQRYSGLMTRDLRSVVEAPDDRRFVARGDQIVQLGSYTVEKNLDLQGKVIFDRSMPWEANRPATDAIFSRGLALRYAPNTGYGYINTAGDWVVKPQYWQATVFSEDGAVVAEKSNDAGLYSGRLIDTQGSTLARLPPARCYTEASRGFLLARVPGAEKGDFEMALMTTQGQIVARLRIAPSDEMCPKRLRWMDDDTLVAGRYWLRKDGSVVQDGFGDVRYDEIMAVQPAAGAVYVRLEDPQAPTSLEQHRAQVAARKNSEAGFYESQQLRPLRFADWNALKEPDYHHYKAARLYVDERWPGSGSFDYHLHAMVVEVKARDGRAAHDNTRVLAEAGCRVPPGWKLVKSDILVVPRSRWFGNETEDWLDWVRSATGSKNVLWSQQDVKLCEHERMVDGKVEKKARP